MDAALYVVHMQMESTQMDTAPWVLECRDVAVLCGSFCFCPMANISLIVLFLGFFTELKLHACHQPCCSNAH